MADQPKYSVDEIDALRRAVEFKYLFGTYSFCAPSMAMATVVLVVTVVLTL